MKPITIDPDVAAADGDDDADPSELGVALLPVRTWESVLAQPTSPKSAEADSPWRTARRVTVENRDSGTGRLFLEVIAFVSLIKASEPMRTLCMCHLRPVTLHPVHVRSMDTVKLTIRAGCRP